jgi:hypothetical protein
VDRSSHVRAMDPFPRARCGLPGAEFDELEVTDRGRQQLVH